MTFEVSLFERKRDYLLFFLFIIIIFSINIFFKYQTFKDLKRYKVAKIEARIVNQYKKRKHNKEYIVFKLQSKDGYHFFTTSTSDLKDLTFDTITLKIFTNKLKFIDLFKGFYTPSFDIRVIKVDNIKHHIENFIQSQHQNPLTKELFLALFIAKPISKTLRDKISNFGISHLIAISGFHLSVLFFIFYTLLKYPYRFFQDRYFPYRNSQFDLTLIILILLSFYLYLLGYIPSLVRSYIMMIVGFILYDRFIKIISFEVLMIAVLFILAFLPSFFFSIGFWFSVSGVFYIFLFLKYFSFLKNWQIAILLNFWVYIMMIPIVHFIFYKFTFLQLLSPLLSLIFIFFYPLELFLHLIGQGDLLDFWLIKLFDIESKIYKIDTSLWFLLTFVTISLFFALKKRKA